MVHEYYVYEALAPASATPIADEPAPPFPEHIPSATRKAGWYRVLKVSREEPRLRAPPTTVGPLLIRILLDGMATSLPSRRGTQGYLTMMILGIYGFFTVEIYLLMRRNAMTGLYSLLLQLPGIGNTYWHHYWDTSTQWQHVCLIKLPCWMDSR